MELSPLTACIKCEEAFVSDKGDKDKTFVAVFINFRIHFFAA
jgi:hypothetical protein